MSETDDKKVANSGSSDTGEASSAKPASSVASLLEEFDNAAPATKPTPIERFSDTIQPIVDFARTEMTARQKAALTKDIADAVAYIKGADETKGMPDKLALGFLHAYAEENPEFADAWQHRNVKRKDLKNALEAVKTAFIEESKAVPANQVRSDVEAAVAAVKGTSTKVVASQPKSNAEVEAMSDYDFAQYKRHLTAARA